MSPETYDAILEFIAATPATDPGAIATCGECGFRWNNRIATSLTPAPAGRCPNEFNHEEPKIYVYAEYGWTCQECLTTVKGFDSEQAATDDSANHECARYDNG